MGRQHRGKYQAFSCSNNRGYCPARISTLAGKFSIVVRSPGEVDVPALLRHAARLWEAWPIKSYAVKEIRGGARTTGLSARLAHQLYP